MGQDGERQGVGPQGIARQQVDKEGQGGRWTACDGKGRSATLHGVRQAWLAWTRLARGGAGVGPGCVGKGLHQIESGRPDGRRKDVTGQGGMMR